MHISIIIVSFVCTDDPLNIDKSPSLCRILKINELSSNARTPMSTDVVYRCGSIIALISHVSVECTLETTLAHIYVAM